MRYPSYHTVLCYFLCRGCANSKGVQLLQCVLIKENPVHCPTDLKRPQPPYKIETAPALPVEYSGIFNPVQFIVHVCFEVFIVSHYIHINPLD